MFYNIAKWFMNIFLSLKIHFRKRGEVTEKAAVQEFIKKYNIKDLESFTDGYKKWYYEIPNGRYMWDQLWGAIDVQQDQQFTLERGGGDCDDHSRLVQLIMIELGYEQYQQQYLQKPIKMSHGTCVVKINNKWTVQDYQYINPRNLFDTPEEQIQSIAKQYGSEMIKQFYFDEYWNKLTEIK